MIVPAAAVVRAAASSRSGWARPSRKLRVRIRAGAKQGGADYADLGAATKGGGVCRRGTRLAHWNGRVRV
jgi:hypothetical protein